MSKHNGRLATPDDFVRFYGRAPPEEWCGFTAERDGVLLGMGSIYWDQWGRAWLFFNRANIHVPAITMHRLAKRAIRDLATTFHEEVVHAFCDTEIANADKWLERLGFKPAPEMGGPVMVWKAQCQA